MRNDGREGGEGDSKKSDIADESHFLAEGRKGKRVEFLLWQKCDREGNKTITLYTNTAASTARAAVRSFHCG